MVKDEGCFAMNCSVGGWANQRPTRRVRVDLYQTNIHVSLINSAYYQVISEPTRLARSDSKNRFGFLFLSRTFRADFLVSDNLWLLVHWC